VAQRPRIIVVDGPDHAAEAELARELPDRDFVRENNLTGALEQSRDSAVAGVFLATQSPDFRAQADRLVRSEHILETLSDGVAILDGDLSIVWSNPAFDRLAGGPAVARPFAESIRCAEGLKAESQVFAAARADGSGIAKLACDRGRYWELSVRLAPESRAENPVYVVQVHDISDEERRQRKLDALHHAGLALTNLDANQLAEMTVADRVEFLKADLRRFIHDVLHYDVIEIRLLNRQTGELVPLLADGMMPEAAGRVLHAKTEGNGVTGYVAATGKSYRIADTTTDSHYIAGAAGARSSLTVPLIAGDDVIGTFNVESPRPNAFSAHDLQFTETFSRVIAQALHTLELLTAEKRSTATASLDAVSREVALPVDDILSAATALLARTDGHDPDAAEKLRQILAGARSIKQSIQKVGENLVPPSDVADGTGQARLKGLRVLVVDCDDRIRRSAHALLGRFGCQVETAKSGQEALAMARVGAYDAILVDIRLPDLNGYDAYRQLRDAQPQARMVLLSCFGYDAGHSIVKARQDGLRFVLYKPFRVEQLVDALVSTPAAVPGVGTPPQILRT
jgi:CheY-like chemotaxis protein/PAS domain-containing protein